MGSAKAGALRVGTAIQVLEIATLASGVMRVRFAGEVPQERSQANCMQRTIAHLTCGLRSCLRNAPVSIVWV